MKQLLNLFVLLLFLVACKQDTRTASEKHLETLHQELEKVRKEVGNQREIDRLEAEIKNLSRELKGNSTGTAEPAPVQQASGQGTTTTTANDGQATGTISGANVNLRASASVKADRVATLDKGEVVKILSTEEAYEENEAILAKNIELFANNSGTGQAVVTLNKGKAVVIESYENGGERIKVAYQHPQKGKLYATIKSADVENLEGSVWYQVRRNNGQTGWVIEKFIQTN